MPLWTAYSMRSSSLTEKLIAGRYLRCLGEEPADCGSVSWTGSRRQTTSTSSES